MLTKTAISFLCFLSPSSAQELTFPDTQSYLTKAKEAFLGCCLCCTSKLEESDDSEEQYITFDGFIQAPVGTDRQKHYAVINDY